MAKFTITYQRKVQVRPYEMLDIGLSHEFNTNKGLKSEDFNLVKNIVDGWIDAELYRLQGKPAPGR